VYLPSLTEISIFAGAVAAFCLGFMGFAKLFPLVSIWEIEEGRAMAVKETVERVEEYLPDDGVGVDGAGSLPEGVV